jgi:copper chaperone CopZ
VQAALKSVKGVTKVTVGAKTGTNAETVVKAGKSVKVKALITALKKAGFGATEKKDEAKKAA